MRIITVTSEQDISALVPKLFKIPASGGQRIADAVRALTEANPHLGSRTKVPAGTPIVVPDLPDLPPKAAAGATDDTLHDLQAQVRQALDSAKSAWGDSSKLAAQDAQASLEVLRAADFKRSASTVDVNVASLTERVKKAVKDVEAQSKVELKNLDALGASLDELITAIDAMTGTM